MFVQSYDEGSSYTGFFVNDFFQFSSNPDPKTAPRYTFGCVTRETNLFVTQSANGIMGLAPATRENFKPVFYTYFENGHISHLIFSLLLGKNGGKIYFGGYDDKVIANKGDKIKWFTNVEVDNYAITFNGIQVADIPIPTSQVTARIDSGVTMTYMTKRQHSYIDQAITNLCMSGTYKCLGVSSIRIFFITK